MCTYRRQKTLQMREQAQKRDQNKDELHMQKTSFNLFCFSARVAGPQRQPLCFTAMDLNQSSSCPGPAQTCFNSPSTTAP